MSKLVPVFLDFETFYSVTHSLSKMQPAVYVMHPDTEIISVAIKVGERPTVVVFGEDKIREVFARIPWDRVWCIAHNMQFDGAILAWRFGVKPAMWGCTLSMARPFFAKTVGVSLKAVAEVLGVGAKLDFDAVNAKGKHLCDFSPEEVEKMREYNRVDTDLCALIFKRLGRRVGIDEMRLIDLTIRMWVNPVFDLDDELLSSTLATVRAEKKAALLKMADLLGVAESDEAERLESVRATMASAPKFKALLEKLGIEVPMKVSKTAEAKGVHKLIPALAKSDEAFLELLEHDDLMVSTAASTRLGVKSTLLETRMVAFIDVAAVVGGTLPIPLRYAGADTTLRWSGSDYNPQNMPRLGKVKKHSDALRSSLVAPPGFSIIVADQSGIELRVNHFLWQVKSSVRLFNADAKADLYRAFAAARYGISVDQVTDEQRQLAKVSQLGLGFGAGFKTFQKVAKLMGGIDLDEAESESLVNDWRSEYHKIVTGWRTCHEALSAIYEGRRMNIDPAGLCYTSAEGIHLPRGMVIHYPGLHEEPREGKPGMEWWYGKGRHRARIYAGKVTENIVQRLARDVIAGNMLKFQQQTGLCPAHMIHDELVYVVPESEAVQRLAELQAIMRTPIDWWPEMVVWSEGGIGKTYGSAKK